MGRLSRRVKIEKLESQQDRLKEKMDANDDIINIPISDLTYIKLDTWVHDLLQKYSLTKKQYYNLCV